MNLIKKFARRFVKTTFECLDITTVSIEVAFYREVSVACIHRTDGYGSEEFNVYNLSPNMEPYCHWRTESGEGVVDEITDSIKKYRSDILSRSADEQRKLVINSVKAVMKGKNENHYY